MGRTLLWLTLAIIGKLKNSKKIFFFSEDDLFDKGDD